MAEPLVSVIILNWNGERFLKSCLSSLFDQTYSNREIIVVDNCSTDGSLAILESMLPKIKLIRSGQNLGFAAGNNLGIENSTGELIVLLNNDTEVDPGCLEVLVKAFQQAADIGMCAAKVRYLQDREILNSTGVVLYRDLTALNRGIGEKDQGQYDQSFSVFCPYGAAATYKREMLDRIGLLDEDYFMFREEDELGWRANLAGWKCVYVPEALVYHHRSAATKVFSVFKLYYGERNRLYTCFKYLSASKLCTIWPATLKRYLFSSKVAGKAESPAPSRLRMAWTLFRAYLEAVGQFFEMRKKGRLFLKTHAISRHKVQQLLDTFAADLRALRGQFIKPAGTERQSR
jgi:GT2 family glycosyltransferase